MKIMMISLFGSLEARQQAKGILENHASIRRVDVLQNSFVLRLILSKPICSEEVVEMLARTGLTGIQVKSEK